MIVSILLIVLWVIVATMADIKFKAAAGHFNANFVLGAALYCSTSIVALASFNRSSWGWIIIFWNCFSLAVGLILSIAIYHEVLTTKRIAAAAFLAAAMLLAE